MTGKPRRQAISPDLPGPREQSVTAADDAVAMGEDQSPQQEKSIYHPASPEDCPLSARVAFVLMDGPEGKALGQRQAEVMRRVLRWIGQHRDHTSW